MACIFRSTETLSGFQRRPRDQVSYFDGGLLPFLGFRETRFQR